MAKVLYENDSLNSNQLNINANLSALPQQPAQPPLNLNPNPTPRPPILPEQVVQWAWGFTIAHSGSENETEKQLQEQSIRKRMDEIKKEVQDSKRPLKGKDIEYINNILTAVDGAVRTLLIIIRGRATNFKETDSHMELYIKKNESINNFRISLQSAFGRVASMTFGGTSATAIVLTLFPNLTVWFFPLILFSICSSILWHLRILGYPKER
jgi:hypothetical protein